MTTERRRRRDFPSGWTDAIKSCQHQLELIQLISFSMAVTFVVFAFIRLVKVKFRFKELFGEPRTDFISNVPKSAEHLRFVERFF